MTVAALVLGAGRGERFRRSLEGERSAAAVPPKAFARLGDRSLLARAALALCASAEVDAVWPVLPADQLASGWADVAAELQGARKLRPPVAGGAERQDSVRCGLAALGPEVTHVAIHDAARPLVRPEDVSRVVRAARDHGAAILAVPAADTIQRVVDGRVVATPPRSECWAAQTPQVFRIDWLREALEKARAEGFRATDDAELVLRLGVAVHVVEGDPRNLKVTRADDLLAAAAWLAAEAPR